MESQNRRLVEKIASQSSAEGKRISVDRSSRVVSQIAQWAASNDIDISNIERLGGGFVNLILLVQTTDGDEYVAKNFEDPKEAEVSRSAQKIIDRISDEDTKFIPQVVSWIDDGLLLSEKAAGAPVVKTLRNLKDGSGELADASAALYAVGHLVGLLHERTQSHSGPSPETGEVDAGKIITDLEMPDLLRYANPTLDTATVEKAIRTIQRLTDHKHVSVVHGDTHLNQFFYAPDLSLVTIVDYDSVRIGDPMFDVSRSTASLRVWCQKLGLPYEIETTLTQDMVNGYRDAREASGIFDENEFDYVRVVAYEMKLYLVQLKRLFERGAGPESKEFVNTVKSISECIEHLSSISQ